MDDGRDDGRPITLHHKGESNDEKKNLLRSLLMALSQIWISINITYQCIRGEDISIVVIG